MTRAVHYVKEKVFIRNTGEHPLFKVFYHRNDGMPDGFFTEEICHRTNALIQIEFPLREIHYDTKKDGIHCYLLQGGTVKVDKCGVVVSHESREGLVGLLKTLNLPFREEDILGELVEKTLHQNL